MNQDAIDAVNRVWVLTVKARALCPWIPDNAVGGTGYYSAPWYQARGEVYLVSWPHELKPEEVNELREVGGFINRSFIISLAAVLEEHGIVPSGESPDPSKEGGEHVTLIKLLRNRFAHGEWEFDSTKPKHVETRELIEKLFPDEASRGKGFVTSIDEILEPLKDNAILYIKAVS